jgi:autotransporter translocation and assembly factor TamB
VGPADGLRALAVGQDRRPGHAGRHLGRSRLSGRASLDGGGFEDGQTGLRLRNITLRMGLADNAIDVSQASAEDGQGGTMSGRAGSAWRATASAASSWT